MDYRVQHICISYIACRLITGKSPAFLCDLETSDEMEVAGILDIDLLHDFDEKHQDYIPGFASNCTYQYTADSDFVLNIFINEKTFIVHINGSASYFIGNLRNDTIYLYDHDKATHFRYRITAYIEGNKKEEKPKVNVFYEDED